MTYPATIDAPPGTAAQGTTLLSVIDHALDHRTLGSAVISIETKVGVNSGSAANNQILVGVGAGSSTWGTTWNGANLGTPTLGSPIIGTVTVPGTVIGLGFSAAIAPGVGTITDNAGGTLTVNAQQGNIFYCVMGTAAGNRTIGTPLNPTGYQLLTYAFKASGSANGTLVWPSIFRLSQDTGTPALGTGSTWNYYGWRYNQIDTKYDFIGQSKNLI